MRLRRVIRRGEPGGGREARGFRAFASPRGGPAGGGAGAPGAPPAGGGGPPPPPAPAAPAPAPAPALPARRARGRRGRRRLGGRRAGELAGREPAEGDAEACGDVADRVGRAGVGDDLAEV